MTRFLLGAAMLAALGLPASAATISLAGPTAANGTFDITVQATNLFAGRDTSTDGIISYGFNLAFDPLLLSFDGADSGPLFDAPTTVPGTDVFGAASGFGIFPPVTEPLELAILHFTRISTGTADVTISSDLLNPFQGLQYVNEPFAESIDGKFSVADAAEAPEPATLGIAAVGLLGIGILRRRKVAQTSWSV
jgi:hypothetical protein